MEVIVSDDGSTDQTVLLLPHEFPGVRLVTGDRNRGFAAACNLGFREARFRLISLLNNDVQVDRDYLLYQSGHFSAPNVFAVTARVFEWDAPIFSTGGRFGRFRRGFWSVYFNYDVEPSGSDWVHSQCLLSAYAIGGFATYDREKLMELGGFNELLSPFHWEDVDLSYRAWKRGWEVHYEPRSRARHRTSATIEAHYSRKHVEQAALRNRLLFHWINLHSGSYLAAHLAMLLVLTASRFLLLDFGFYRALAGAVQRLPEARRLRKIEKAEARRSDRQLQALLKSFYRNAPIRVYYNHRDVVENHPGVS